MRAWWVVVLAAAIGAAPVSVQRNREGSRGQKMGAMRRSTGRRLWQPFSVQAQASLAASNSLLKAAATGGGEGSRNAVLRLGTALTRAEAELSALDQKATGADRRKLVQVRAEEQAARAEYQALAGSSDPNVVAQHAAALRQHMLMAQRAWGGPARIQGGPDPQGPDGSWKSK